VLGLGRGSWVPIYHNVSGAYAYLRAKFHLDPSNRLATTQQRHRQTGQTVRQTDNGPIAYERTVYERSPQNWRLSTRSVENLARSQVYHTERNVILFAARSL